MEPRSVAQNSMVKDGDHPIPEDRLRSTSVSSASSAKSASSDFSFEDPYQLDINDHGSFALDNDRDSNSTAPVSRGSTSTLETPPVQMMERPPDTSSDYRIPSRVFASNKSGNPNAEWSTASNESLFSIHTGNMSFTRDQFSWLLKSGELGTYTPGDIRKSGELPPPSPKIIPKSGEQMPIMPPPDTYKSGEQIIASHFKAPSASTPPAVNKSDFVEVKSPVKVIEADGVSDLPASNKKDDPMPEVKVKKGRSAPSDELRPPTCVSPHHSDASGQSFAFPVLADIGRDKSVNSDQSHADKKKSNPEQDGPKTPTSTASPPPSSSWFSRISRCSCW